MKVKFRFLFSAFASFLFLGDGVANCIDLTGQYLCDNGTIVEWSQSTDNQKVVTYRMSIYNIPFNWVADAEVDSYGWRTVCDENRMRRYHLRANYVIDLSFEHSGSVLAQSTHITGVDVTSFDHINNLAEEDFNTAQWPTRVMHCERLD